MKLRRITAITATLLLFVSGGGFYAEAAAPAVPAEEEVYQIEIGGWESGEVWRIDRDGNEVPAEEAPEYEAYTLLDIATEEPRYERRTREEVVRDAEGWPNTVRWRSLWDLQGSLLLDWERMAYDPAFDEYIIRQDARDGVVDLFEVPEGYHTALYHVPTGKELYIGAFSVEAFASGDFLLKDKADSPMGVLNASAEVVSGFPPPKEYYNARVWGDTVTADNMNYFAADVEIKKEAQRNYILDKNFREIFSAEWISLVYGSLRGDYAMWRDGGDEGIYSPEEGILFKVTGASVEYFDGELAIVQTGEYRGDVPIDASLVKKDNTVLASGFSWLKPDDDSEEAAKGFVGVKDGKAVRIDRNGAGLAASEPLPDIRNVNRLCEGLYTFDIETETTYGSGLLDADMKLVIPAGKYTNIYLERGDREASAEDVLVCGDKEIGSDAPGAQFYRTDVFDRTGKVIVDNVTAVHGSGPDRVAITRGFTTGLMDWSGNWIVKRSIFDNAMGD